MYSMIEIYKSYTRWTRTQMNKEDHGTKISKLFPGTKLLPVAWTSQSIKVLDLGSKSCLLPIASNRHSVIDHKLETEYFRQY